MSEDAVDAELAELRAWKAEVLRRNAVPPRAAADEIERLSVEAGALRVGIEAREQTIARLTRERDEARSLIPSEGDGACDNCGVIPSHAIPTNLCDHCVDGLSRAEAEAADEARARTTRLISGIRAILGNNEGRISTHYEGCDAVHWRCGLTRLLRESERKDGAKCETCGGFERVCRCHGEPPNALCYELIPCPACKGGKDGAK